MRGVPQRAAVWPTLLVGLCACNAYTPGLLSQSSPKPQAGGSGGDAPTVDARGGDDSLAASGGGGGALSVSGQPNAEAGAAGEGGSPGPGGDSGSDLELIDDFEDGDASILRERPGDWVTDHDASRPGSISPDPFLPAALAEPERPSSVFAAHVATSGLDPLGWGALLRMNLVLYAARSYDASAYCGLSFWARRAAGSPPSLWLYVSDANSIPAAGRCNDAVSGARCFNHFRSQVPLGGDWAEHRVLFADMLQDTWGYQAPSGQLQVNQIYSVEFSLPPSSSSEIWVDDMAFVRKAASGACPH